VQHPGNGLGVQACDHPQRHHLGLVLGQRRDHGDGLPGGEPLQYLVFDWVTRGHRGRYRLGGQDLVAEPPP
jgi:hypothetical protein